MKFVVAQSVSITIVSKILSFLSLIYIAKILSQESYGKFVYVSMVLSLLPLLQFGSMNGATILLPKYIAKKNGSETKLFWTYNTLSYFIQFTSALILFFIDFGLHYYVTFVISVNYILSKYIENVLIFLYSNLEYRKANIIRTSDEVFRPVATIGIFSFYKNIESIFASQLLTTVLSFVISNYFIRFRIINIKLEEFKKYTAEIYKIGFFVYLIWGIDILFRSADRWFISQFYPLSKLAEYGFASSIAMNIWTLAMAFFSPYSQLLYKFVAEKNFLEAKKVVEHTNRRLYILLVFVSLSAIIVYPIFIELFIKKYYNTTFLFFILVICAVFLSINNMYIYYMISNNLHFVLLRYQVFILLLNLLLNSIFAFYRLDIVFYSYSTIFTLGVYFLLVRRYFYIDINNRLRNNEVA